MFADTDPRSLPGSIIHFNRLLNDIAISQILGNESAQRPLEFVIRFMSKLSLKICWTNTEVIIEIAYKRILEVSFIQHDDVIQTLPADGPDDSLCVRVLPGTPGSNQHFINFHTVHPLLEVVPVHLVAIAKKILGYRIVWKSLHDLLRSPFGCRVLGHIEMDESAPMMREHDQDEEHLESHRWYDEEVDGHQIPHMVF